MTADEIIQPAFIQISAGAAAAISIPLGGAIVTGMKFGWNALFAYIAERDNAKTLAYQHVVDGLTALTTKVAELCARVEEVDRENRIDVRANNKEFLAALTTNAQSMAVNTQATLTMTTALNKVASAFDSKTIPPAPR